jgi:hypothetical protein
MRRYHVPDAFVTSTRPGFEVMFCQRTDKVCNVRYRDMLVQVYYLPTSCQAEDPACPIAESTLIAPSGVTDISIDVPARCPTLSHLYWHVKEGEKHMYLVNVKLRSVEVRCAWYIPKNEDGLNAHHLICHMIF